MINIHINGLSGKMGTSLKGIVDKNKDFYFMEMNTRIQVEHPITEMVTGVDLIKWQIKMHAGEKFPEYMKQIKLRWHSIECRINAEDPNMNFAPSPMVITDFHIPGGKGCLLYTSDAADE